MPQCFQCRAPLSDDRRPLLRMSGQDVCHVCLEMYNAAGSQPGLAAAQHEWEERQQQLRKLFPNGNYFER